MFSVCIFDDTGCCDAIVHGREGERLLGGVTAEQLHSSPSLQKECESKLRRAVADGATFEFEIITYLTANVPHCDEYDSSESDNVVDDIDAEEGEEKVVSTPASSSRRRRKDEDLNSLEEQDADM